MMRGTLVTCQRGGRMDKESQRQLEAERDGWLHRGRAELLAGLLRRGLPPGRTNRLLEVGPGAGSNLATMAGFGTVDVVEVSERFAERLRAAPEVRDVHHAALPDLQLATTYDAIVAFDVLEHIDRDDLAVAWVSRHLRPGGLFVASVPAYPWLFSDHDRAIHHFRRYTRGGLERLVGTDLRLVWSSYFNTTLFPLALASRVAWQARRRLAGRSGQPGKQPVTSSPPLDRLFLAVLRAEVGWLLRGRRAPFGLSVVCVARRRPPA